jgi:hypothetical protein
MSNPTLRARPCGECASTDLGVRLSEGGRVGRVICRRCGASGESVRAADREAAIEHAITIWNRCPPLPAARAREAADPSPPTPMMQRRRGLAPHSDERDPLELVARLLVGGSWRVPTEGRSSRPTLQPCDVAGAVGLMRGKLEREAALAVATRAGDAEIARLAARAYRRVMREVVASASRAQALDLGDGADRWRLRMVIYDAAQELVWPERRPARALAARRAKMRRSDYAEVHRAATSVLQQAVADARSEFGQRLFAG